MVSGGLMADAIVPRALGGPLVGTAVWWTTLGGRARGEMVARPVGLSAGGDGHGVELDHVPCARWEDGFFALAVLVHGAL